MDARLTYRLPISVVRIAGTVTTTTDGVLGTTRVDRAGTAQLTVGADPVGPWSVDLDPGQFRDTSAAFALTDDGRLTSASAAVTGRGGEVLSAFVTLGTTLVAVASKAFLRSILSDMQRGRLPAAGSEQQRVDAAYLEARPAEAAVRTSLQETVKALDEAHRTALAATTGADPAAALRRARQLATALADTKARLTVAEALFGTWRSGTIQSQVQSFEFALTADELRMADPSVVRGVVQFGTPTGSEAHQAAVRAAQARVRAAWETLGCLVLIQDDPPDRETVATIPAEDRMTIRVRHPRPAVIETYRRTSGGAAVLESVRPVSLLDGGCWEEAVSVKAGWFGKGSGGITFSADGVPTGFTFGESSNAAGVVAAVGGIPAGVADALATVSKVADQATAIANHGLEAELARAKSELALRQTALDRAGLAATDDQFAAVAKLQRDVEDLRQRRALGLGLATHDSQADEIARLTQEVELLRRRVQENG